MTGSSSSGASEPITVAEIREIAKTKLSKQAWEYYKTGADAEITLGRNEEAYSDLLLRPRFLRDVSQIDTSTQIFGKRYDIPIAIAPSAYQKLAGGKGEVDNFRASHKLGTNYILSTAATTSLEEVISCAGDRDGAYPKPWFQLYFMRNRDLTRKLIERAEKAGYEALVLTIDTPILGNRIHERKDPLKLPSHMAPANMPSVKGTQGTLAGLILNAKTAAEYQRVIEENADAAIETRLVWHEVVPWLRAATSMKIILKGVMTSEDALRAVEAGVDGIVVSNHGGRQLDGAPATIEALPEVAEAVAGRIPVIFDGGITRGSDVFKAIALGADLCLIGRTALWGLAYDGQNGVETVLNILERELHRTMTLSGAASIRDISRSMLGKRKINGFGIAKL
ncbi:FMN-dependent dehydrogenase [Xylariales sp. PMI_506]|nr:FMN-dependent dehydrogenase [Xylariales sp. PMI_506]